MTLVSQKRAKTVICPHFNIAVAFVVPRIHQVMPVTEALTVLFVLDSKAALRRKKQIQRKIQQEKQNEEQEGVERKFCVVGSFKMNLLLWK